MDARVHAGDVDTMTHPIVLLPSPPPLSPAALAFLRYAARVADMNDDIPTAQLLNVATDAAAARMRLGLLDALTEADVRQIEAMVARDLENRSVTRADVIAWLRCAT